jgi:hypothetical protein
MRGRISWTISNNSSSMNAIACAWMTGAVFVAAVRRWREFQQASYRDIAPARARRDLQPHLHAHFGANNPDAAFNSFTAP